MITKSKKKENDLNVIRCLDQAMDSVREMQRQLQRTVDKYCDQKIIIQKNLHNN